MGGETDGMLRQGLGFREFWVRGRGLKWKVGKGEKGGSGGGGWEDDECVPFVQN